MRQPCPHLGCRMPLPSTHDGEMLSCPRCSPLLGALSHSLSLSLASLRALSRARHGQPSTSSWCHCCALSVPTKASSPSPPRTASPALPVACCCQSSASMRCVCTWPSLLGSPLAGLHPTTGARAPPGAPPPFPRRR